LKFAVVVVVGVYVALCVIARLAYPRILFPAPKLVEAPVYADGRGGEAVSFAQANGSKTAALWFSIPEPKQTIVLFHGNGETIFHNLDIAHEMNKRGHNVLLVEYRGYGITYGDGSPPTEAMLYEDGEAAITWLKNEKKIPTERTTLWGASLGTGVAAELAARGHASKLVLLTPYTSITAMGRRVAPILPVSLLLAHRFDTLSKAPQIKIPTLVIHGDEDEIIPFTMGQTVSQAIANSRFIRVTGGHHNDLLFVGSGTPNAHELFETIASHLD